MPDARIVIQDVANALDTVVGDLGGVIPGASDLDTALNQVLTGLETLLAGVLTLVADLYVPSFIVHGIHC